MRIKSKPWPYSAYYPNLGSCSWSWGLARAATRLGTRALITCRCGPNAMGILDAAGIEVISGAEGSVRGAVHRYREGSLRHNGLRPMPAGGPQLRR